MMHVTIVASPALPAAYETVWLDEHACAQAAALWAQALSADLAQGGSRVIHLHGTLGAGKTTFTRHLLRAMGVSGRIKSPSYAVVEPHETAVGPVLHFDFYRFNDPAEWEDAGFRDLFAGPGLKLVEWPQQAGDLLPPADAELHLTLQGEATDMGATEDPRQVKVLARSPAGQTLIDAWHQPAQQEAHHV
jgi:tRNA threonylcarbamoyladenosine biosynthesis protein TsaE